MRKYLILITVVCSILMVQTASANLVVNGGFETGDFTGWTQIPAPFGSVFGVSTTEPHSGTHAAFFGAVTPPFVDTITQAILTTVGQAYTFDFWLRNDAGPANTFSALWGGTPVLSLVNSNAFPYTHFTFTEVAAAASTTIAFAGYQVPSFFRLDDVNVSAGFAAVPLPGTLALLGSGLLPLLGWRRFRKS